MVPAASQCAGLGEADATAFRSQFGVIEPKPGEGELLILRRTTPTYALDSAVTY